jgi:hypothetical protein
LKDERRIARNLVPQLIVYSTGTPAGFADCAGSEKTLDDNKGSGYGISAMIHALVQNEMFLKKRTVASNPARARAVNSFIIIVARHPVSEFSRPARSVQPHSKISEVAVEKDSREIGDRGVFGSRRSDF